MTSSQGCTFLFCSLLTIISRLRDISAEGILCYCVYRGCLDVWSHAPTSFLCLFCFASSGSTGAPGLRFGIGAGSEAISRLLTLDESRILRRRWRVSILRYVSRCSGSIASERIDLARSLSSWRIKGFHHGVFTGIRILFSFFPPRPLLHIPSACLIDLDSEPRDNTQLSLYLYFSCSLCPRRECLLLKISFFFLVPTILGTHQLISACDACLILVRNLSQRTPSLSAVSMSMGTPHANNAAWFPQD